MDYGCNYYVKKKQLKLNIINQTKIQMFAKEFLIIRLSLKSQLSQ
jgi:hypothetical protein